MDSCLQPVEVDAYVSKSSSEKERVRAEKHISECELCRTLVESRDGQYPRPVVVGTPENEWGELSGDDFEATRTTDEFDKRSAAESFEAFAFKICFFGHTHLAGVFSSARGVVEHRPLLGEEGRLSLLPEVRYLVNPGSVGQPRDRDPRAAYMIYDSDDRLLSWFRTEYPIERAQSRILEAGLPPMLAERLAHGV